MQANILSGTLVQLLQKALWGGKPLNSLCVQTVDDHFWKELLEYSRKQEVLAFIYEALPLLPISTRPPQPILMEYASEAIWQERIYDKHIRALNQIYTLLQEQSIPAIMLKGLSIASLYPIAKHRHSGDIDLLIPKNDRKKVEKIMMSQDSKKESELTILHDTYSWNDIQWEFHYRTMKFACPYLNHIYNSLEQKLFSIDQTFHYTLEGKSYPMLNPMFNIIYMTAHIQKHLLVEYVTFRHLCDWTLMVYKERTSLGIAENRLIEQLKKLDLYNLYQALGYIAINYLNMPSECHAAIYPSAKDREQGDFLWESIQNGHIKNCVPYIKRKKDETLNIKFKMFRQLIIRCYYLRKIAPIESFFKPFEIFGNAIKRELHNITNRIRPN